MPLPRSPSRAPGLVTLVAALATPACVDSVPASPRAEVRDSAGITIVTNARPGAEAPTPWTLGAEPSVSIGVLDGAEPYLLSQVRTALRLGDGRIAVANDGTKEIRFYDAGGSHLRSVGGEGEGPGEFMSISAMMRMPGDSLGVWDYSTRRLTLLDPAGELGRSVRMEESEEVRIPFLQARLSDGSFLATAAVIFMSGDNREGLVREPVQYMRFGADGTFLGPVLSLPGSENLVISGDNFVRIQNAPFARASRLDVGPDGIVAGATDRYELGFYDVDGTLRRLLRTEHPLRTVDADLREAYEQERLDAAEDEEARAGVREDFETLVYPPSLPAFSAVEVDVTGHVWVQDYRPPGEDEGPDTWLVYDPEGRIVGAVELPGGFTVFEIGEDYVLGRLTDELEVERILMYGLDRGA